MKQVLLVLAALICAFPGCGGGGSGGGRTDEGGSTSGDFGCDGSCANQALSVDDVNTILKNAVGGATALATSGTFAIVDRVGNVLAVYQMAGAPQTTVVNGQTGAQGGLEGASVPATLAAISKAGTGAFLSSQGNGFSTRTASQIIQENFNPGERDQPAGPLFGVQFSQLPCSDITKSSGPHPLPLGLSADPGGIPLYKQGDLVGGIGVEFDGLYSVDRNISDNDDLPEERVALVASKGFEAPSERIAPNVNVGKSLRYTDLSYAEVSKDQASASALDASRFVAISGFSSSSARAGVPFGSPASGVAHTVRAGVPAMTLTFGNGGPRYPTRSGSDLSAAEVDAILDSALLTANRTRAAIRRPLDTSARVSIWVVDRDGTALGFIRSQDAPVFGIDVSLQKARAAAFFSSADVGGSLSRLGLDSYVSRAQTFVGAGLLGSFAFSTRALGNISRPFYPDGLEDTPPGPFSLPIPGIAAGSSWSPFNDGIQLDLTLAALLAPLHGSIPSSCVSAGRRLANGLQIFAGGVPLYRGHTLIGAIGVSGDGTSQDDLVAFFGASRPGLDFAGYSGIGDLEIGFNAPKDIRADLIAPVGGPGTRLRYVNCPEGPFIESNDQNVCENL